MSLNILVVNDIPSELKIIKKTAKHFDPDWNLLIAESYEQLYEILENEKIEVLISGLEMEKMDGTQLLQRIKENYPSLIRILLTENSNSGNSLTSARLAHQTLIKSSNPKLIKNKIAETIHLRRFVKNEEVLKIVNGLEQLPSLPDLYLRLEEEMSKQNISMRNIGEIIARDITMTAKILQMVNSAFFRIPQKISNPVQAINYLGLEVVKSLVLFAKVFSSYNKNADFSVTELWNHSLKVATYARDYILLETQNQKEADEAYIAGLLHDLGKLVFLEVPGYLKNVNELIEHENYGWQQAEYELYQTSHAELGAYILGLWGLPDFIVEGVAFHHDPPREQHNTTASDAVYIANSFSQLPFFDFVQIQQLRAEGRIFQFLEKMNAENIPVKES